LNSILRTAERQSISLYKSRTKAKKPVGAAGIGIDTIIKVLPAYAENINKFVGGTLTAEELFK
jgi:hypothetical protein